MTTSRFEALCLVAAVLLPSCGQSHSGSAQAPENGQSIEIPMRHVEDIKRLVRSGAASEIEQKLPPLLATIRKSGGSVGSELVAAGFDPAPALPSKYGYERADGTSIGVALPGDDIEVRVNQESPR
jgi:hypothetical protein